MPTRASQIFADYVQIDPLSRFAIPDLVLQPQLFNGYAPGPPDPRVLLDGVANSYVSTPDSPALDGLTDIDVRVCVALNDWNPTGNIDQDLMGRWGAVGHEFRFSTGQGGFAQMEVSTDGTNFDQVASTTRPPADDGAAIWLRVRRTDLNADTDFFTAPYQTDEPATWTNLTLNRTSITGAIFDGTVPLTVGGDVDGTDMATGAIYRACLYSAGVKVADFDPRDWNGGTSWVSSRTGEVWTLNGNATIAGVTPTAVQRPYWGTLASR